MKQHLTRTNFARALAVLLGLILLALAFWAVVAGPVTVLRILRYGDTDIDDFSHYPGRQLAPAATPFLFAEPETTFAFPPGIAAEFGYPRLEELLAANDTIAFVVIQDDMILFENYFQGHSQAAISQPFSMSKSITSGLVGMAIQDGYLEGVDQPLVDLVPELVAAGYGTVTLEHLLTMQSGTAYVENDNPFSEHVIFNYTPNLVDEILAIPMERPPGKLWRYKSGDNALLALALDRALGEETITAYAQRRLWDGLGMAHPGVWTTDREDDGLEKTWCCLAAAAEDFAKIGRLYLNNGQWNGVQVLPPDWVARATRPAIPADRWPEDYAAAGLSNYGYQWWLLSPETGDYLALGKDGQYLYINPATGATIVRLGWSQGEIFTSAWVDLFQSISAAVSE